MRILHCSRKGGARPERLTEGKESNGCPHPPGRAQRGVSRTLRACAYIFPPAILLLAAAAQDSPGARRPSVTLLPSEVISVARGHSGTVELIFRVPHGYHINSNIPHQEYLKKTVLKLNAPTDILVRKISYPDGEDRTFPFAPDEKINVYTGDFTVTVEVRPLKTVLPSKYAVHGSLKYQACDNAACYPPREAPVTFEVKVTKATSETKHKRTPQSPHAHT